MKLSLLLVPLALSAALYSGCSSTVTPIDEAPSKFSTQDTVVYYVPADKLAVAQEWYTAFFGRNPEEGTSSAAKHILYKVDGVLVVVGQVEDFSILRETLFYWQLPTPEAVEAEYKRLYPDSDSESGLVNIEGPQGKPVKKFVAKDPAGNPVGVCNNPIYVPQMLEPKNR